MAFDKLCRENKKDSALRLAGCMLKHSYISLGIGDIDWEIDMAIRQCGGEPRTGYRYTARFHFNLKTEMERKIRQGREGTVWIRRFTRRRPQGRFRHL